MQIFIRNYVVSLHSDVAEATVVPADDEMPILQIELYMPLVSSSLPKALGTGPDPLQ